MLYLLALGFTFYNLVCFTFSVCNAYSVLVNTAGGEDSALTPGSAWKLYVDRLK